MVDYSQALQYTAQELISRISELEIQIETHQLMINSHEQLIIALTSLVTILCVLTMFLYSGGYGHVSCIVYAGAVICAICVLFLYFEAKMTQGIVDDMNDELEFLKTLLENKQAVI